MKKLKLQEPKSTTKKGLIGVIWHFTTNFFTSIFQILFIAILARLLEPEEFGCMAFILILTGFSDLFSQMGIGGSLIQMVEISSKHIKQGYNLGLGLGVLIATTLYLIAPTIANTFNMTKIQDGILAFAFFIPLSSINSISQALLLRQYKFPLLEKIGLLSFFIGNGLVPIILAYNGFGYWSLLIGQFVSILIKTVFYTYNARVRFSISWHKKEANELLFFGGGHTLGTVFNYFAENADNIIISRYSDAVGLGFYSKGFQLFAIPAKIFGGIFDKIMFPILSQKKSNEDKLKAFYLFCISTCFTFLFPMALWINANSNLIVEVILGKDWIPVSSLLQVLIIGLAFRFGTKINKSFIKSLGIVYQGALYQFIFFSTLGLACYIGIIYSGLQGVTYGVLVATVLNFIFVFCVMCYNLKIKSTQYIKIIMNLAFFLTPLSIILIVTNFFNEERGLTFFIISLIAYISVLWFSFSHSKSTLYYGQNKDIMSQIINNLPLKLKTFLRKNKLIRI